MQRRISELSYALIAVIVITCIYAAVVIYQGQIPGSSGLFGHLIGVLGSILMLMTQFLYSIRKSYSRAASWGRLQSWLDFHIFTGIVGPYMVLLHTAWRFNGLAGVVTLIMILIVISGFIGRYVYTAIPRTADGIEFVGADLESQIINNEAELQNWFLINSDISRSLPAPVFSLTQTNHNVWSLLLARPFFEWGYRWRWWVAVREQRRADKSKLKELSGLLVRRRELYYQIANLVLTRRVLAIWHSIHVPLTLLLFAAAFLHVSAAIYYVTLAK